MLRSLAATALMLCFASTALANPVVSRVIIPYSSGFPHAETPNPSLTDINGEYIGFTHRLPGTGAGLVGDWNYFELFDDHLDFRGHGGGLAPQARIDLIDMPAVEIINPYSSNATTHYAYGGAAFSNIRLGEFGKAGVFIGIDSENVFLVGVEAYDTSGVYKLFAESIVNGVATRIPVGDVGPFYIAGTDVDLMFGRGMVNGADDFWMAASTADSPPSPFQYDVSAVISIPEFASSQKLHVGIFHYGDGPAYIVEIDSFWFASVPEPSTYLLGVLALLGLFAFRRRR